MTDDGLRYGVDYHLGDFVPPALTPTDFLLARIAEDEAVLRALIPSAFGDEAVWAMWDNDIPGEFYEVAGPSAARLLRECEAKRRIVGALDEAHGGQWDGLQEAIQHLAAVYADHPDYRQEWKP